MSEQSRLDQLIAEGKLKPPKRKGPLPEPLEMDLEDPDALLRALDETREEWDPTPSG